MTEINDDSDNTDCDVHKTIIYQDASVRASECSIVSYSPNTLTICGRNIGITKEQLVASIILSLNFFFNWAYYSLFAPFFPEVAISKGMSASEIGIIFGAFQFVLLICSPIFGKYLNEIGVKFLLCSGLFLAGGSMIIFAFMDLCPRGISYFILCVLTRATSAIGTSMSVSYAIVGYFFPQNVATVVAVLETFTGLGLMIGPVIGGFLFEIGGFRLPFFFMGVVILTVFLAAVLFFPNPSVIGEADNNTSLPLLPLLKVPQFNMTLLMIFCGSLSINFIEPSIQIHLLPLNLTPVQLGLVFLAPALIYVIITPIVGYICDRFPKTMPWFIMISSLVSAFAYCFFGPFNFFGLFDFKLKLSTFVGAYILFGISFSGLIVPVYAELMKIARTNGYPDDIRTQGLISGTFSCVFSTGALLGPIMGGFIVDLIGFDNSTFLIVIFFIVSGLFYSVVYFVNVAKLPTDDTKRAFLVNQAHKYSDTSIY